MYNGDRGSSREVQFVIITVAAKKELGTMNLSSLSSVVLQRGLMNVSHTQPGFSSLTALLRSELVSTRYF